MTITFDASDLVAALGAIWLAGFVALCWPDRLPPWWVMTVLAVSAGVLVGAGRAIA